MSQSAILIVEDEAIVAADLSSKLQQLGYSVTGAVASGEEAVALARKQRPALVLMDIRLSGAMDGITAANAIREECDLPVVFLTAHSDAATLDRAKISEPFGFIIKPFEERELRTTIEMAIFKHRADRKVREQREWLRVTLASIGDAVVTCDTEGRITYLNPVAEALTGWTMPEVLDRPIQGVFRLINEQTQQPCDDPVVRVLRDGCVVTLANHTALINKAGRAVTIEDSAAPILDAAGRVIGVVLVFHDVTEKRRADEQMRVQAATLEATANAVAIVNPQGIIQWVNPAFTRLTGYSAADAVGQNPRVLKSGQHPPEFYGDMWRTVVAGRAWRGELVNKRKDGNLYMEEMTITPVKDTEGAITHFIAIKQDVTERKRAEDTLRFLVKCGAARDEDFFQSLARHLAESLGMDYVCIDRLHDGVLAAQTVAVYHDGRFEDNVSYTLKDTPCGEVVGQRICCFPREVRHLFPKDAVLQTLRAESYVGATLWNSQGQPIGLIAIIGRQPLADSRLAESILQLVAVRAGGELERRHAEEALRTSESRYRSLFNTMSEGFAVHELICDAAGQPCDYRFLAVNPAFERLTGLRAADVIGRTARDVLPRLEPIWLERFGRVTLTGVADQFESWNQDLGRWYQVYAARNEPGRFTVVFLDITQRKQAEEQVRQLNAELEQRVRQRTAELEAVNHELEAFSYSVSHDLKAPLRGIDGFSQALLEDYPHRLDSQGQDYLQRIRAACQRMGRLIEDLLNLSRLCRAPLQCQTVSLSALAHQVLDELRQSQPERAVQTRVAEGLTTLGDPNLLRAVLFNLLHNAWKFTSLRTEALIEFGTHLSAERGVRSAAFKTAPPVPSSVLRPLSAESPVFFVRDNGAGFDMAYADKLFAPFQRLHAATEYPGTGIGLALVQRVIRRHGGRIWVEAGVGQGATFYFTLYPEGSQHGQ